MADIERMAAMLNADEEIHRCEKWGGDFYKVFTNYLLGVSNDFLPVYLVEEDGIWYFTDANTIFAVLDDYYVITERLMKEAAKEAGLTFHEYRFLSADLDENNVLEEIHKYGKVITYLLKKRRN